MRLITAFFVLIFLCSVTVSISAEEIWTTYTPESSLLAGRDVRSAAIDPNGFLWIGTSNGLLMYDGTTWTTFTVEDGLGNNSIGQIAIDKDGVVWAVSEGVSRYKDGEWMTFTQEDGLAGGYIHSIAIAPNGDVWCSTMYEGISHYDGETWETFTTYDGLGENSFGAIAVGPDGIVWSAIAFYGIVNLMELPPITIGVSRYDGESWTGYTTEDGKSGANTNTIAIDASGVVWITTESRDGLYSFSEGVFSRITEEDGLPYGRVDYVTFGPDGDMWVAVDPDLLARYDGENWTVYSEEDGLPSGWYVSDMAFDTNGVVVAFTKSVVTATNGGLSILGELSIGEIITDVDTGSGIPESFGIVGNSPNPFNPSTTISFSIPERGSVTLSVYDITGQKVATLIDKQMSAGSHSVIFDGSYLGSGVYLYRLESEGFEKMGKMLLMK